MSAVDDPGRDPGEPVDRVWLAVLAHELRSPLSAIIGYGELLSEGALGSLEDRAVDAVDRMRVAADQLLRLVEGIEELFANTRRDEPPEPASARDLLIDARDALGLDAQARGASIIVLDDDADLLTRVNDVRRCLMLVLAAALKSSPGATLTLAAVDAATPTLTIAGSALHHERDDPDLAGGTGLTGAGLRLSLARRSARLAGGSLALEPTPAGATVHITLPRQVD